MAVRTNQEKQTGTRDTSKLLQLTYKKNTYNFSVLQEDIDFSNEDSITVNTALPNNKNKALDFYNPSGTTAYSMKLTLLIRREIEYTSLQKLFGKKITVRFKPIMYSSILTKNKWIITEMTNTQSSTGNNHVEVILRQYYPAEIRKNETELTNLSVAFKKCLKHHKDFHYGNRAKLNKSYPKCVKALNQILIKCGYLSKNLKKSEMSNKQIKAGKKIKRDLTKYTKQTSIAFHKFRKAWVKKGLSPKLPEKRSTQWKGKTGTHKRGLSKEEFTALIYYKRLLKAKK